jgi:hypothetical protein
MIIIATSFWYAMHSIQLCPATLTFTYSPCLQGLTRVPGAILVQNCSVIRRALEADSSSSSDTLPTQTENIGAVSEGCLRMLGSQFRAFLRNKLYIKVIREKSACKKAIRLASSIGRA